MRAIRHAQSYKVACPPRNMSVKRPKYCACHTESSPCPNSKMKTVSQNETFDPLKPSKYWTCHKKWLPKAQACQCFRKVQKVRRLPHRWKSVLRPALATQNGHNSKNERGALVKLHLRKSQNHDPHLVRACAVEMHMDISEGNFCTRIYSEKTGAQMEPRFFTLAIRTPQGGHCLRKQVCFEKKVNKWHVLMNVQFFLQPRPLIHTLWHLMRHDRVLNADGWNWLARTMPISSENSGGTWSIRRLRKHPRAKTAFCRIKYPNKR